LHFHFARVFSCSSFGASATAENWSRRAHVARTKKGIAVEHAARRDPAVLFAFDALVLGWRDLRKLPLLKRKKHFKMRYKALSSFGQCSTWANKGGGSSTPRATWRSRASWPNGLITAKPLQ
jgi:hypothetical protein